ncbi:MAG TPA: YcxB family protein [Capsulimonadaceae bacterium]
MASLTDNPLTIEYERTYEDYVRINAFAATGKRNTPKARLLRRIVVSIASLLFTCFAMYNLQTSPSVNIGDVVGLVAGAYVCYSWTLGAYLYGLNFAKRNPTFVGRYKITACPDLLTRETDYVAVWERWAKISNIEYSGGDILVTYAPRDSLLIPRSAFSSEAEAASFYELFKAYWEAASKSSPAPWAGERSSSDVWPPSPEVTFVPMPEVGPEYSDSSSFTIKNTLAPDDYKSLAPFEVRSSIIVNLVVSCFIYKVVDPHTLTTLLGTTLFILVVIGVNVPGWLRKSEEKYVAEAKATRQTTLGQTIVTDFKTLTVSTPESVTVYQIRGFDRVQKLKRHLFIYIDAARVLIVPYRHFDSRAAADSFADQLAAAIKAEKAGATAG